jgi:hypothetical protein
MATHTREATPDQLEAARRQGAEYGRALEPMTRSIAADGGESRAGSFPDGCRFTEPADVEIPGVRVAIGQD